MCEHWRYMERGASWSPKLSLDKWGQPSAEDTCGWREILVKGCPHLSSVIGTPLGMRATNDRDLNNTQWRRVNLPIVIHARPPVNPTTGNTLSLGLSRGRSLVVELRRYPSTKLSVSLAEAWQRQQITRVLGWADSRLAFLQGLTVHTISLLYSIRIFKGKQQQLASLFYLGSLPHTAYTYSELLLILI